MDCREIREVLDAYAVGAADAREAKAVEKHVADCVRCWDELTKAQRTAALLALTGSMHEAPESLEARIMSAARGGARPGFSPAGLFGRVRIGWPAAAGSLGLAGAAALVFAVFLQAQVNDLEGDRDSLEDRVVALGSITRVATAEDVQTVSFEEVTRPSITETFSGNADYRWSSEEGMGVIVCHGMVAPPEDKVYQAWYVTETEPVPAGTFTPDSDGGCLHLMEPEWRVAAAVGVGITHENAGGARRPTGDWLVLAELEDE